MELLDYIETQIVSNRLPLVAVTVAAVPCANTPFVLSLHWHGFVEVKLVDSKEAQAVGYESVPSSALQINERWDNLEELDRATLSVAWELGAWDVARIEALGCNRPGADRQESIECMSAFGTHPYLHEGNAPFVADVPDAEDLLELAKRRGYLKWQFRPVRGGLWGEVADDVTLNPGGYRNPPCPVGSVPARMDRPRKVVYRFGRSGALLA